MEGGAQEVFAVLQDTDLWLLMLDDNPFVADTIDKTEISRSMGVF